MSKCSRFLVVTLGAGSGHSSRRGPSSDGWRSDRGATPTASIQPVSQDQNSASLSGLAESSGAPRGVRCRRSRSILHDAAGIALRVGEHHPGHIALTDVEVSCTQPEQPLDFLGLAGPAQEVQVESRRLEWRLGDALEAQVEHRSALDGEPRLEGIRLVGQPLAAEYCLPEPAQPLRLDGVDDVVLQILAPTVGPAGVDIASHDTTLAPMPPAMSRRLLVVNTAACRMRIHCERCS